MDRTLITKTGNANGNSGTVDDIEVVAHAMVSIGLPVKSPSLVYDPPHIFLMIPELVMVPRMLWSTIVYLEQGSSKVSTVNNSTYNVTQPTKQSPILSNTVTTDKSSYGIGDAIVISGTVKLPIAGTPVVILILDPNNLLLQSERIFVSSDGRFQTIITTTDIWKQSGTYTVWAQYGLSNERAQTTFYFES